MSIKKNFLKYKSRGAGTNTVFALFFILFFIYSLTLIYPFVWAFINSLKTNQEYWNAPFSFASTLNIKNYARALAELKVEKSNPLMYTTFLEMLFNSIWFTFGGAFLGVMFGAMATYVVVKYNRFKICGIVYKAAIIVLILPVVGTLPAYYKLYNELHLTNSPLFLLTCCGGIGSNMIYMYGFFSNISWNYAESAFIDGASNWTVFRKIMLPQARPGIIALYIIACIRRWNDYTTPYLFLKDYATISTGLFCFKASSGAGNVMPVYFAGIILSLLPILIMFIAFQDIIMKNMSVGGLKG